MRFARFVFPAMAFAALFATPAAQAENCDNAADQATMNECADKAYKASDAELNKLYKRIHDGELSL